MMSQVLRILDATSQLGNVILYRKTGTPNHSISGDAYRFSRYKTMAVIDFIFSPFEKNHCRASHEADVRRAAQLIAEEHYESQRIS